MAEHGAFMLSSAQGGPQDPEFRDRVHMLTVRTARRFGRLIEQHSGRSYSTDAALGVVAMSTLERSWFYVYGTPLNLKPNEVMDAVAETLHGLLLPVRSDTAADASPAAQRISR
jgi:hypothetical protein